MVIPRSFSRSFESMALVTNPASFPVPPEARREVSLSFSIVPD
jgi:hypothetical protein